MCIAIYKPAKIWLKEPTLEACWDNNPDGAGFMYAEKKKLHIVKGLMTFNEFKDAYEPHKGKEIVLHFRIKTHGGIVAKNTHPFSVTKDLGVVHNGIISKVDCDSDKSCSDTWHFTEQYLKYFAEIHPNFWHEQQYQDLIGDYIGHSKLIFMDKFGDVEIINESLGTWQANCWFSNTSYEKRTYTSYKRTPKNTSLYDATDSYDEMAFPNTKIIPISKKSPFDLRIGDFVKLDFTETVTNPDFTGDVLWKGTRVRIEYFGTGQTVAVINPINNKRALTSSWKIEHCPEETLHTEEDLLSTNDVNFPVGKNAIFTKNFNHFRIGDVRPIEYVTKDYVIVKKNVMEKKTYAIPKQCMTLENFLIVNAQGEATC